MGNRLTATNLERVRLAAGSTGCTDGGQLADSLTSRLIAPTLWIVNEAQATQHADRQFAVSPVNGARIPLLRKGESGNPAGGSAKARMQRALARVVEEADGAGQLETVFRSMLGIASDQGHPLCVSATKLLADRTMGPVVDASAVKIEVVTVLRFEDRKGVDEQPVPQRITAAGVAARLQMPEGDSIEVDTNG